MQSVSDFSNFKTHEEFSKQLKKLSDTFLQKNLQDSQEIKNLVGKWIQHFDSLGVMKAVNLSGTFNTLSKLGIFGKKWQKEGQDNFKSLIVKLAEKGKEIKQFNPQAIANILNALSKWNVLNTEMQEGSKEKCKTFIVKLVDQGIKSSTQFNSQEIANTFDALYKFDILDDKKWTRDKWNKIKLLIVQLAKKGQEQKVLENFDFQAIANTFNAFSKLDIFNNKWTGNEQKELKSLIVQLAKRGGSIEGYNLKEIAKIYSALLKWSNDADEFESFTDKLAEQVQAIAEKQNEEDNILDNIRFASQIINDLPKLKLENLITSESKLLISLIRCLSTSVNSSDADNLKDDWSKKNILFSLQGLYEIVSKIEDRSSLKGIFDTDLPKIYSKLMEVKVSYANEVLEKINKLGELKNSKLLDKSKRFTVELRVSNKNYNKACDKQIPASNLSHSAQKKKEDNQLLYEFHTKDLSNQRVKASSSEQGNSLQNDKKDSTIGRFISAVSGKLFSLFNFVKGYFSQAVPTDEQTTDTKDSQPFQAVEDKIIEAVKQIISERELERSNINFKQMKKKIVQKIKKGNFDGISKSIASRIFEKDKFKNVECCEQIVERKINPLIQNIPKNRNSMLEVPESHLNDIAVQGHTIQARSKLR